jgi:predicted metal-dependent HD superfamily phosphohydrolase
VEHIETCLRFAQEYAPNDPYLALAICYHDVIYDTHASDNERRSADYARDVLKAAGANESDCAVIARLILATTHRNTPEAEDEKVLVDIDLAILGGPQTDYDHYVRAVRQEYAWVSDQDFRKGRSAFLRTMLARATVFSTPRLGARFEERARSNLRHELAGLEG